MKWAAAVFVALVALTKEGVGFDVSTRSASFDALLHAAAARGGLGKNLESGIANVWEHALDKQQERVSEQPLGSESASANTAAGTREDHAGVKGGGTADVYASRTRSPVVACIASSIIGNCVRSDCAVSSRTLRPHKQRQDYTPNTRRQGGGAFSCGGW